MAFYGNRTNACFVKSYESVTNLRLNRFLTGPSDRAKKADSKELSHTFRYTI